MLTKTLIRHIFFQSGVGGQNFLFIFHGFQKLSRAAEFFFLFDVNTHVRRRDIYTHKYSRSVTLLVPVPVLQFVFYIADDNN